MTDLGLPANEVRKWGRRSALGYVLLVLCVAIAFGAYIKSYNNRTREGAYGSCHRLNITRAVDNENNYNDYQIFTEVLKLSEHAPPQPEETAAQRKAGEEIIAVIRRSTTAKQWVPLTDCKKAVDIPYRYVPPQPRKFSKETPSARAFVLGANN
jgi:hypothetical protein